MTDTSTEMKVTAASNIEVDREALDASIKEFAGPNGAYYCEGIHKIHDATSGCRRRSTCGPPCWALLVRRPCHMGHVLDFPDSRESLPGCKSGAVPGGIPAPDMAERAERQPARAQDMLDKAAAATEQADIDRFNKLASNLQAPPDRALRKPQLRQAEAFGIMLTGLVLLLVFKLIQGFYADTAYEKQYSNWRIDAESTESGRYLAILVHGVC